MSVIVTSHGADFFGQDHYQPKDLAQLAGYAEAALPGAERSQDLVRLLEANGAQTIPPGQAAVYAEQLRRIARSRYLRPQIAARARSLGDAAARAAADGEPWTWTTTTGQGER